VAPKPILWHMPPETVSRCRSPWISEQLEHLAETNAVPDTDVALHGGDDAVTVPVQRRATPAMTGA
jgi:hypothetical protein